MPSIYLVGDNNPLNHNHAWSYAFKQVEVSFPLPSQEGSYSKYSRVSPEGKESHRPSAVTWTCVVYCSPQAPQTMWPHAIYTDGESEISEPKTLPVYTS